MILIAGVWYARTQMPSNAHVLPKLQDKAQITTSQTPKTPPMSPKRPAPTPPTKPPSPAETPAYGDISHEMRRHTQEIVQLSFAEKMRTQDSHVRAQSPPSQALPWRPLKPDAAHKWMERERDHSTNRAKDDGSRLVEDAWAGHVPLSSLEVREACLLECNCSTSFGGLFEN